VAGCGRPGPLRHTACILAGGTFTPPKGKENVMIRLLSLMAVAALLATAMIGCKASGEVGDTATQVGVAR